MSILLSNDISELYQRLTLGSLINLKDYEGMLRIVLDKFVISEPLEPYNVIMGARIPADCNIVSADLITNTKTDFNEYELNVVLVSSDKATAVEKSDLIQDIQGEHPVDTYYSMYPNFIFAQLDNFIALKNISDWTIAPQSEYLFRLIYARA